jgi:hypothetical protein
VIVFPAKKLSLELYWHSADPYPSPSNSEQRRALDNLPTRERKNKVFVDFSMDGVSAQGDQIGRIFAHWAIVFFGRFFENDKSSIRHFLVTFSTVMAVH